MSSLQEQLMKSGLADKKKARRAKQQKREEVNKAKRGEIELEDPAERARRQREAQAEADRQREAQRKAEREKKVAEGMHLQLAKKEQMNAVLKYLRRAEKLQLIPVAVNRGPAQPPAAAQRRMACEFVE